jgi:hypothetical protein
MRGIEKKGGSKAEKLLLSHLVMIGNEGLYNLSFSIK